MRGSFEEEVRQASADDQSGRVGHLED